MRTVYQLFEYWMDTGQFLAEDRDVELDPALVAEAKAILMKERRLENKRQKRERKRRDEAEQQFLEHVFETNQQRFRENLEAQKEADERFAADAHREQLFMSQWLSDLRIGIAELTTKENMRIRTNDRGAQIAREGVTQARHLRRDVEKQVKEQNAQRLIKKRREVEANSINEEQRAIEEAMAGLRNRIEGLFDGEIVSHKARAAQLTEITGRVDINRAHGVALTESIARTVDEAELTAEVTPSDYLMTSAHAAGATRATRVMMVRAKRLHDHEVETRQTIERRRLAAEMELEKEHRQAREASRREGMASTMHARQRARWEAALAEVKEDAVTAIKEPMQRTYREVRRQMSADVADLIFNMYPTPTPGAPIPTGLTERPTEEHAAVCRAHVVTIPGLTPGTDTVAALLPRPDDMFDYGPPESHFLDVDFPGGLEVEYPPVEVPLFSTEEWEALVATELVEPTVSKELAFYCRMVANAGIQDAAKRYTAEVEKPEEDASFIDSGGDKAVGKGVGVEKGVTSPKVSKVDDKKAKKEAEREERRKKLEEKKAEREAARKAKRAAKRKGEKAAPEPKEVAATPSPAPAVVSSPTPAKSTPAPVDPSVDPSVNPLQPLVDGFTAIKHGRRGKPQDRYIALTDDKVSLRYRDPSRKTWKETIPRGEVEAVTRGADSKVFSRAKGIEGAVCLTVAAKSRTLDLQFDTQGERDKWAGLLEGWHAGNV